MLNAHLKRNRTRRATRARLRGGLLSLCGIFIMVSPDAFATGEGILWSEAKALNSTSGEDSDIDDSAPAIANDGAGGWVAVWQAHRMTVGSETDWDVLYSRSTDKAATWSAATPLNTDAGTDSMSDTEPFVAGGPGQVWLALWIRGDASNSFIAGARSADGGQSWNAPFALSTPVATPFGFSVSIIDQPHAATDGRGTWVAVWAQEGDIFRARSTDNGISWGAPTALITTARTLPDNAQPRISTDGAGNWLIVWSHFGALNGLYDDRIIAQAFSNDNGVTWNAPSPLTNPMTTVGATRSDRAPRLATDAKGTWTVMWSRADCCGNEESDIFSGQSFDNDFSFIHLGRPHPHFDSDTESDATSALATDSLGNWLMLFWTEDSIDGAFGADYDIFSLRSTDNGATWAAPQPVNSTAASDGPPDHDVSADLSTDGHGTWVAVWRSYNSLNGTIGSDPDILFATTAITGTLRGIVRDAATSALVDCAALVITDTEPDIEVTRVVPANKVGEFEASNLPPGNYVVRLFSAQYESAVKSIAIEEGKTLFIHFALDAATFTEGIRGGVSDADNGQPLVGVRVLASIGGVFAEETYTCGDGHYAFRNLPALKAPTTVTLKFELGNYTVREQDVVFNPGAISDADTQLSKFILPGSIAGVTVSSASSAGIPHARITLLGRANISTETDATGVYALAAVPEGRYSIEASAEGFQSSTVIHSVPNGEIIAVDFVLDPVSAPTVGDVNADNQLDAVDVQLVINGALDLPVAFNVDLDSDGLINAIDVQLVINAVLAN